MLSCLKNIYIYINGFRIFLPTRNFVGYTLARAKKVEGKKKE